MHIYQKEYPIVMKQQAQTLTILAVVTGIVVKMTTIYNSNMNEENIDIMKTILNEIDVSNFCVFCARCVICDFNYNSIKKYKPPSNITIKCLFCSKFIPFYLLEKLHDSKTNLIAKFCNGKLSFLFFAINKNNTHSTKEKKNKSINSLNTVDVKHNQLTMRYQQIKEKEKNQIKNQKHHKIQVV